MSLPTKFLRAEGVSPRSRLSEEERSTFYDLMKHTVVEVRCYSTNPRIGDDEGEYCVATGFIVNSKCDILTHFEISNNWVFTRVRLFGEKEFRLVSVYPKGNVVLLKLREPINKEIRYAHIIDGNNNDDAVSVGMEVYCIGHKRDLHSFLIGEVVVPDILLRDQPNFVKALKDDYELSKVFSRLQRRIMNWHVMKLSNVHGAPNMEGAPIFNSRGSVIGMWVFGFANSDYAHIHSEFKNKCNEENSGY